MAQYRTIKMIVQVEKGETNLIFTQEEFKDLIESMQEHLKDGIHSLDMFSDGNVILISRMENKN